MVVKGSRRKEGREGGTKATLRTINFDESGQAKQPKLGTIFLEYKISV